MESSKYPRTYHFPFSLGTTSDDRIRQNWQNILQNPLVITEKLDGENTCLKTSGVYARSHAAPTQNPWAKNMLPLWESLKNDLGDLALYGENLYGIHSITYTHLETHFYLFGIQQNNKWLSWEEVEEYAQLLNLPTVPVLAKSTFQEAELEKFIHQTMQNESRLGGEIEGVVCRNAQPFLNQDFAQNVLKYVRKNHVKTDEHWTRNWKRAPLYFEKPLSE